MTRGGLSYSRLKFKFMTDLPPYLYLFVPYRAYCYRIHEESIDYLSCGKKNVNVLFILENYYELFILFIEIYALYIIDTVCKYLLFMH